MSGTRKDDRAQFELPLFGGQGEVSAGARVVPQVPASPRRTAVPESPVRSAPAPSAGPRLRVIQGEGQRQREKLGSRDAVVRVLLEAGADLLLRRISPERAGEIERRVDRVLHLFDQVDDQPLLMSVLQRQLDDLEALMRETREMQASPRRAQHKP